MEDSPMFELSKHEQHPFLVVRHSGPVCVTEVEEAREAVSQLCDETQTYRILVDLRDAATNVSMRDALALAESVGPALTKLTKTALLGNQEQRGGGDILTFYGMAARNRDHNVQVFTDVAMAEEWLLE